MLIVNSKEYYFININFKYEPDKQEAEQETQHKLFA